MGPVGIHSLVCSAFEFSVEFSARAAIARLDRDGFVGSSGVVVCCLVFCWVILPLLTGMYVLMIYFAEERTLLIHICYASDFTLLAYNNDDPFCDDSTTTSKTRYKKSASKQDEIYHTPQQVPLRR